MVKLYKGDKMIKIGSSAVVMVLMLGWNLHAGCIDPYDHNGDCGADYITWQPVDDLDDEWHTPNSHGSREDVNWNHNINGDIGDPDARDDHETDGDQ